MAFYIPGVVLASREMKKRKEGGGGGTVLTSKKRGYEYDKETASTLQTLLLKILKNHLCFPTLHRDLKRSYT